MSRERQPGPVSKDSGTENPVRIQWISLKQTSHFLKVAFSRQNKPASDAVFLTSQSSINLSLTLNSLQRGENRNYSCENMNAARFFAKVLPARTLVLKMTEHNANRFDHEIASQGAKISGALNMLRTQQYPPDARKSLRRFQLPEVADLIGVTQSHLRQLHSEGKGPEIEVIAGRRYYTAEQMLELRG